MDQDSEDLQEGDRHVSFSIDEKDKSSDEEDIHENISRSGNNIPRKKKWVIKVPWDKNKKKYEMDRSVSEPRLSANLSVHNNMPQKDGSWKIVSESVISKNQKSEDSSDDDDPPSPVVESSRPHTWYRESDDQNNHPHFNDNGEQNVPYGEFSEKGTSKFNSYYKRQKSEDSHGNYESDGVDYSKDYNQRYWDETGNLDKYSFSSPSKSKKPFTFFGYRFRIPTSKSKCSGNNEGEENSYRNYNNLSDENIGRSQKFGSERDAFQIELKAKVDAMCTDEEVDDGKHSDGEFRIKQNVNRQENLKGNDHSPIQITSKTKKSMKEDKFALNSKLIETVSDNQFSGKNSYPNLLLSNEYLKARNPASSSLEGFNVKQPKYRSSSLSKLARSNKVKEIDKQKLPVESNAAIEKFNLINEFNDSETMKRSGSLPSVLLKNKKKNKIAQTGNNGINIEMKSQSMRKWKEIDHLKDTESFGTSSSNSSLKFSKKHSSISYGRKSKYGRMLERSEQSMDISKEMSSDKKFIFPQNYSKKTDSIDNFAIDIEVPINERNQNKNDIIKHHDKVDFVRVTDSDSNTSKSSKSKSVERKRKQKITTVDVHESEINDKEDIPKIVATQNKINEPADEIVTDQNKLPKLMMSKSIQTSFDNLDISNFFISESKSNISTELQNGNTEKGSLNNHETINTKNLLETERLEIDPQETRERRKSYQEMINQMEEEMFSSDNSEYSVEDIMDILSSSPKEQRVKDSAILPRNLSYTRVYKLPEIPSNIEANSDSFKSKEFTESRIVTIEANDNKDSKKQYVKEVQDEDKFLNLTEVKNVDVTDKKESTEMKEVRKDDREKTINMLDESINNIRTMMRSDMKCDSHNKKVEHTEKVEVTKLPSILSPIKETSRDFTDFSEDEPFYANVNKGKESNPDELRALQKSKHLKRPTIIPPAPPPTTPLEATFDKNTIFSLNGKEIVKIEKHQFEKVYLAEMCAKKISVVSTSSSDSSSESSSDSSASDLQPLYANISETTGHSFLSDSEFNPQSNDSFENRVSDFTVDASSSNSECSFDARPIDKEEILPENAFSKQETISHHSSLQKAATPREQDYFSLKLPPRAKSTYSLIPSTPPPPPTVPPSSYDDPWSASSSFSYNDSPKSLEKMSPGKIEIDLPKRTDGDITSQKLDQLQVKNIDMIQKPKEKKSILIKNEKDISKQSKEDTLDSMSSPSALRQQLHYLHSPKYKDHNQFKFSQNTLGIDILKSTERNVEHVEASQNNTIIPKDEKDSTNVQYHTAKSNDPYKKANLKYATLEPEKVHRIEQTKLNANVKNTYENFSQVQQPNSNIGLSNRLFSPLQISFSDNSSVNISEKEQSNDQGMVREITITPPKTVSLTNNNQQRLSPMSLNIKHTIFNAGKGSGKIIPEDRRATNISTKIIVPSHVGHPAYSSGPRSTGAIPKVQKKPSAISNPLNTSNASISEGGTPPPLPTNPPPKSTGIPQSQYEFLDSLLHSPQHIKISSPRPFIPRRRENLSSAPGINESQTFNC